MKYPNLELYKDLKPCEDNLFDFINKNFLIIDSYWMLRIISIVDELPDNPSQGDTYLIDDSIALFDGMEWSFTDLKDGMYFYIISEHDFFYYDGGLKSFGEKYGDVTGPEGSLNNSVAIFDGTTGKTITDSKVFIENRDTLISENIYGDNIYSENAEIDNLAIGDSLTVGLNEFNGGGEDAEIPDERGIQFVLTNNNLESISKINKTDGNLLTLLNNTGRAVVIKNGSGIITGTEKDIDLNNEASILLQMFDEEWYIVGGTGSGSGGGSGSGIGLFYADSRTAKVDDWVAQNSSLSISEEGLLYSESSIKWDLAGGSPSPYFRTNPFSLGVLFSNAGGRVLMNVSAVIRVPPGLSIFNSPLSFKVHFYADNGTFLGSTDTKLVNRGSTGGFVIAEDLMFNSYFPDVAYGRLVVGIAGVPNAASIFLDALSVGVETKPLRNIRRMNETGGPLYNIFPWDDIVIVKPVIGELNDIEILLPDYTGSLITIKFIPRAGSDAGVIIHNAEPENDSMYANESRTYFYDEEDSIWRSL